MFFLKNHNGGNSKYDLEWQKDLRPESQLVKIHQSEQESIITWTKQMAMRRERSAKELDKGVKTTGPRC